MIWWFDVTRVNKSEELSGDRWPESPPGLVNGERVRYVATRSSTQASYLSWVFDEAFVCRAPCFFCGGRLRYFRSPAAATSTTYHHGRPGACHRQKLTLIRSLSTAGLPARISSPHIYSYKPYQRAGRQGPAVERGILLLRWERPRAVSRALAGGAPRRCLLVT